MAFPPSDHYDGKLFFNPEPTVRSGPPDAKPIGMGTFLRARLLGRNPEIWSRWPKHVANRTYPPGQAGEVTFIGHATFLIRLPGLTVLTDPVFSARCSPTQLAGPKRVRAPGIALEALPPIDLILLSHNHYDHQDLISLRAIRRRNPEVRIVTGLGNPAYLAGKGIGGATGLDWWEATQIGDARITAVPARHFAARTLWDRNTTLWCGLVLEYGDQKLYFAGDTGYTKFFAEIRARLGEPDFALLPIGAYEPRWFMGPVHMNPADAVRAFQDVGARRALGMHYGTFQLTAEPIDAPPRALRAALAAAGIAEERFRALDVGESVPVAG